MQRLFKISVNGKDYDVAVQELTDGASQIMPRYTASAPVSAVSTTAPAPAVASTGDQCAQMGGVVVLIYVKEGQSVNEGDRIVELEAMKMKVPVVANRSGKVTRVLVAVGDGVENGQALLSIE
ncbi:biotin/lipoyl-containing protein [Propionivibrio sp.]|uniref:biotin/lipoyl-containing protein n=1 Tax=Propionivibrio sp. TaxID=2212460 RepID=UPI002622DEB3|nr:biotin/lipoyl-containing protein [Propionivibrio sp.]